MSVDDAHTRPAGTSDATVEALGKLSEALEVVEDARGQLYDFHRKCGMADLALGEAVEPAARRRPRRARRPDRDRPGRAQRPRRALDLPGRRGVRRRLLRGLQGARAGGPRGADGRQAARVRGGDEAGPAHARPPRARGHPGGELVVMTGWPEPPAVGSETDTLLGSLERQRATFAYKCADLTRRAAPHDGRRLGGDPRRAAQAPRLHGGPQLHLRPGRATSCRSRGPRCRRRVAARWSGGRRPTTTPRRSTGVGRRRQPVARRAARGAHRPADPGATYLSGGGEASTVRRLLVDLIEEYGRHTGPRRPDPRGGRRPGRRGPPRVGPTRTHSADAGACPAV